MAKGNDGNFLQHSVELAAANRLAEENPTALHVAFTHGMAPFECFEHGLSDKVPGLSRYRLKAALRLAERPQQEGEPAIVTAYRCADASQRYPNSAALLRTLGRELSGGISETCPLKHKQLATAWARSKVRTANTSWRCEVRPGGVLACPENLDIPWLFSMDPKTYRQDGYCDDGNLHRSDIELLYEPLRHYVDSGRPGMTTLFVYDVQPRRISQFWDFVDELSSLAQMPPPQTHQITQRGGNKDLVALLYSSMDIPRDFLLGAVEEIEDFALAAAIENAEEGYSSWETISQTFRSRDESGNSKEL